MTGWIVTVESPMRNRVGESAAGRREREMSAAARRSGRWLGMGWE
jgi:hypothetical protein